MTPSGGSPSLHFKNARKTLQRFQKAAMKSHRIRIPKYDFPLRIRPWFIVFTCAIMLLLGSLGLTSFSRSLPLNDKLLHFMCFFMATAVFYFIIDVEEGARRIWFWRHASLMFTTFTCMFCGGILSEVVQGLLPNNSFDFGDVTANLVGSSVGLYTGYQMERHYRHRREIARLYRPVNTSFSDLEELEEEEEEAGIQLLPTHQPKPGPRSNGPHPSPHLADVWDEREELFGVGDESDDEEPSKGPSHSGAKQNPSTNV